MRAYIKERVLTLARHIVETKDPVRKMAVIYGMSKSSVHNDLSKRLGEIDGKLEKRVRQILKENFEDKHIRGGNATKKMFLKRKIGKEKKCFKNTQK